MVSPLENGKRVELELALCGTNARIILPPPDPRTSPSELERDLIGWGDGPRKRVTESQTHSQTDRQTDMETHS